MHAKGFGQWAFCSEGFIDGLCRSGSRSDCKHTNGKKYCSLVHCNKALKMNNNDCYWVDGNCILLRIIYLIFLGNNYLRCKNDYLMVGSCGSGSK